MGAGVETADDFTAVGASYDLSVYGPNGFLRTFAGGLGQGSANLTVKAIYDKESEGIALVIQNHGSEAVELSISDGYSGKTYSRQLHRNSGATFTSELEESFGWYDFTVRVDSDARFQCQLAGHVETGSASMTDPAIGGVRETAEVG